MELDELVLKELDIKRMEQTVKELGCLHRYSGQGARRLPIILRKSWRKWEFLWKCAAMKDISAFQSRHL